MDLPLSATSSDEDSFGVRLSLHLPITRNFLACPLILALPLLGVPSKRPHEDLMRIGRDPIRLPHKCNLSRTFRHSCSLQGAEEVFGRMRDTQLN